MATRVHVQRGAAFAALPNQEKNLCSESTFGSRRFDLYLPNTLFDRDAGFTASYMETLLMTETGIEVLSKLPRTLTVICG